MGPRTSYVLEMKHFLGYQIKMNWTELNFSTCFEPWSTVILGPGNEARVNTCSKLVCYYLTRPSPLTLQFCSQELVPDSFVLTLTWLRCTPHPCSQPTHTDQLGNHYHMARKFQGLKISRFSLINHEPQKFYPRKFYPSIFFYSKFKVKVHCDWPVRYAHNYLQNREHTKQRDTCNWGMRKFRNKLPNWTHGHQQRALKRLPISPWQISTTQ